MVIYANEVRWWTYVEGFGEDDPSGFRKDGEVGQVIGVVGREIVDDGAVVIGVLIRRRDAQDVGADVGVLLDVLDVLLSVEERRVVVDVGDLDGERADALQRALIGGFHRHRDEFPVVPFSVKHLGEFMQISAKFEPNLCRFYAN